MSLPGNTTSTAALPSALLDPDGMGRSPLVDFELGGVGLSDPSQGLQVRAWQAACNSLGEVRVHPWPEMTPSTLVYAEIGITEVALAFDQLMRPQIAVVVGGQAKLYWYDPVVAGYAVLPIPGASHVALCLDDKRPLSVNAGDSDVLMFYARDGSLWYRQQRDRFTIERELGDYPSESARVVRAGMGVNNRVQVHIQDIYQAAHQVLSIDELFIVDGDQVRGLLAGATKEGTWRSRTFEFHDQPSFGWARVDADGWPVTLKVLAGKAAVATLTILSDEPVRLPDVRSREWSVEVSSTARVVAVVVASSREELEDADAGNL